MTLTVTTEHRLDLASLGRDWRALEDQAPDASCFQVWSWVGCLAAERFRDALLVRATAAGDLVGLALFNRQRGRLYLTESGDPSLDVTFVEHNAPLLAAVAPPGTAAAMLRAAQQAGPGRMVLSGIAPKLLAEAPGIPLRIQERSAPYVDLDAVRRAGGRWLEGLSANARYQLRRSIRSYGAHGVVTIAAARDAAEALAWLDALTSLHIRSWRARGVNSVFARPFAQRFHRTLLTEAVPRGEAEVLRCTAGDRVLGYLYNLRRRGVSFAYQSGFDLEGAEVHQKPGLTCHALAIMRALAGIDRQYDLLAGADRYKLTLSNAEQTLLWAELVPRWSVHGAVVRLLRAGPVDRVGTDRATGLTRQ